MAKVRVVGYLDAENQEAIVEISSGDTSLIAYSYPHTDSKINDDIVLSCFLADNIHCVESFRDPHKVDSDGFSYCLVGKVISPIDRLVIIRDIKIILDMPLPRDIPKGAYISFDVVRLDYNS